MEPVEDDADVRRRHPILQDGAVLEIESARPAFHSTEGDAGAGQRVQQGMGVGAKGLLLVGFGDDGPVGPSVQFATLRRIVLERLPRLAEIHRLVDGETVGFAPAELEADVRQFVFLTQRQRQRHVVVVVVVALRGGGGGRRDGRRGHQRLRLPARHVIDVMQIGQIGRWVATAGVGGVADAAETGQFSFIVGGGVAVARRRVAARRRRHNFFAERGVDEIRDAATRSQNGSAAGNGRG